MYWQFLIIGSKVNVTAWLKGNALTVGPLYISFAPGPILKKNSNMYTCTLRQYTREEVSDLRLLSKTTSGIQRSHIYKHCLLHFYWTPDQILKILSSFFWIQLQGHFPKKKRQGGSTSSWIDASNSIILCHGQSRKLKLRYPYILFALYLMNP